MKITCNEERSALTLLEDLPEETLAAYEKYFFEKICHVSTGNRRSFSTPIPQCEGLSFACMQDTVERLTEVESGRLSALQWRTFTFAPSTETRTQEISTFESSMSFAKHSPPSLSAPTSTLCSLPYTEPVPSPLSEIGVEASDKPHPQIENHQTYLWNTNQDIVRMPPSKLSEIGKPKQKSNASPDKTRPSHKDKHIDTVFIVSNPKAELQRIRDANSDVIDAAKAFMGNLVLVKQTKESLQKIESALEEPEARILLEGPARSGKTIIAMSLLTRTPNTKMLLMNWYFHDALKDAFKVWARQDEKEITRPFSPSKKQWMK